MHIHDGVLPPTVWVGGLIGAGAALGLSMRRFREERIPELGVLTSLFFVASSIHFPLAGTEVHLMLNGLVGVVLGTLGFLAIFVALALQALLLGEGGATTIGVNTLVMGGGAVTGHALFRVTSAPRRSRSWVGAISFTAGTVSVLVSGVLLVAVLSAAGKPMARVAQIAFLFQLPVALLEGLVTAVVVLYLTRVRPEALAPLRRDLR